MSSRIQSDLLLVDGALRSSPSRTLLKGGSIDAWAACYASLAGVLHVLCESVLADQSVSAAAASMQWRKSSASKKLLALLRSVVDEAPALQGETAHAAAARIVGCCAVHGSIGVIHCFFWQRFQQSATLWPAMREWIVELGGITSLWTALAWVIRIPVHDLLAAASGLDHEILLRKSVHTVLALTHDMLKIRRPVELAQSSAVITVMSHVLGDLIPRDTVRGDAHTWDLHVVFLAIGTLCHLEGSELSAHLHKPLLVFWPFMIAEMRRQRLLTKSTGASFPSEDGLCGLKVQIHTGHLHSWKLVIRPV